MAAGGGEVSIYGEGVEVTDRMGVLVKALPRSECGILMASM